MEVIFILNIEFSKGVRNRRPAVSSQIDHLLCDLGKATYLCETVSHLRKLDNTLYSSHGFCEDQMRFMSELGG